MVFRFIAVLLCIVLFINGCNSIISQHFGTHKLRQFTIDQVIENNIGDADYIEIQGGWSSGDFVFAPGKRSNEKALIMYPLLSEAQLHAVEQGQKVQPAIVVWSDAIPEGCPEQSARCAQRKPLTIKGIVRKIPKEQDRKRELAPSRYTLTEPNVIVVAADKAPIAWYWNLSMMLGAVALAFGIEQAAFRKRMNKTKQTS